MATRGSEWRKWDLHIHSPGTHGTANKYGETTIDEFCEIIIRNDIACIGLTNYFYIPEKEFNEVSLKLKGKCLVVPNFEFRVSDKNNKGEYINAHIVFNPGIKISQIHKVISRVKIHNRKDKFCNFDDIKEIGLEAVCVDFETLLEELNKSFRVIDDYLVICPYTGYGGFKNDSKPRNCEIERKFDEQSHIIFGSKTFLQHFLNERTYSIGEKTYFNKQKKTVFDCSDAHSVNQINEKFTWIKADPTFEGLKQVIFEPEQRAKIQKDKPDYKEDKLIIDKVKFISPQKVFAEQEIYLNENLNVIIGGKSSGKSILLYSVAKTLLPENSILLNDEGKEKYELKKIDSDFNFEITSKSGITQKMFRADDENSIIPQIKYIPQNYLVKLAEAEIYKKGKSLNKLVRDLINEDIDSKTSYDQFIATVKQNDLLRNGNIESYFNILEEIRDLENELKTKSSKDVLEKNLKSNSEKVDELNKKAGLTTSELEQYKVIQEKIEQNNQVIQYWKEDLNLYKKQFAEIDRLSKSIIEIKNSLLLDTKNDLIRSYYTTNLQFVEEYHIKLTELGNDIEIRAGEDGKQYFVNESIFNSTLGVLINKKNELNESIKPYQQNVELKLQIDNLNKSIAEDRKLLIDIDTLNKNISSKKAILVQTKDELLKQYSLNYKEYLTVINTLKKRTQQLENDGLKIEGIGQFNFPKFYKSIVDVSDGRSGSYLNYRILDKNRKATSEFQFSEIETLIKVLFEDILSGKYVITSKASKKEVIKRLLDDYFFDFWKITYKEDKLGEMSTGKASFVILMLIIGLSQSKAPILIDQPEDNLDNRSITLDLVNYLKNKKLERQILIVTHNANIVVNSDAENIIIANQKGQNDIETTSEYKFDYINGPIENSFDKIESETDVLRSMGIREHIADIVEGGKEAFKQRELKYRF